VAKTMDKDPRANLQQDAGRMPLPERDPAASTVIGPRLPDPADDPATRDETESASTGNSEPKPNDARQQILALKAQAEELRIVGYKWQKAAQAVLAAERQLTALESDLETVRSERDESLAKAAEAQAIVDAARKRSGALEADLEKVRGERDSALAKVAEADEAKKRLATLEADLEKFRSERDGALAKVAEAEATAGEAKKRSAALEADLEKARSERDESLAKAEATADEAKNRSVALEADLEKVRSERDGALAKAEAVERAREAEATRTHASRQELFLNGIVALVFVAALLLLLILQS
jgi:chromosome segregation ATPase